MRYIRFVFALALIACGSDKGTGPDLGANVVIRSATQSGGFLSFNTTLTVENTGGTGTFRAEFDGQSASDVAVGPGYRGTVQWTSSRQICGATVYSRPNGSASYRVTGSWAFGCVHNPP